MQLESLPALPGRRFVGNIVELRRDRLPTLRKIQALGDVALIHMGPRPVMVVSDQAVIQDVLVDRAYEFHKGLNYRFLERMLGKGLVTSEDALHKRQRKLVAPALTPKRIANYADTMASFAERRAATWPAEGRVDVAEEMMHLTLDIVAKTLFDTSMSAEAEAIASSFTEGMRWVVDEAYRLVHWPLGLPFPRHARMRKAMARLDAIVARLIAERRKSGDVGDILSMLLAAKDDVDGTGMSDQQVRDEAITMIFAGHETTANGLAWTFYLLTQHEEIRRRLVAEIDAALGGRTPTLADLPKLPFTLAAFKEAMRLYPPVPQFARRATRPMTVGGVDVPADMVVMINVYGLHHRADLYPDPDRFDPERFLPEREAKLPRHAWLPFASGPRVCIGNHFALMEGQLLLATIAQRHDFTLDPSANIVPEPLVTLTAKHGIPLRVRRRELSRPTAAAGTG